MFFKQIQNKMFPSGFFISDNRIFAIGIVNMAIQILSKIGAHWAIVEEYKTVDENMKREWLAKILKSLEPVATKDGKVIERALPRMQEKQQDIKLDLTNKEKKDEQHKSEQRPTKEIYTKFREEWRQNKKDVQNSSYSA